MSKNKLILAIIWWIILIFVFWLVFSLDSKEKRTNVWTLSWNFNIWIIWDNKSKFSKLMDDFKIINPKYTNKTINVESFNSFDDYYYALTSSIIKWESPDLFVLNNNEKTSIFSEQTTWISPKIINPNDFRKKYKWIFSDDLIMSSPNEDWTISEFLLWVPVWYETLWIFYNRKYVKNTDLKTISWLNNLLSTLKKNRSDLIPIWIWNWSTVYNAVDIITQFFMLEDWINGLADLSWSKLKQSLTSYLLYWDIDWNNWYNSKFVELSSTWENNINLFSKWETYMVIWFPRIIEEINKKWFSKNFLLASPFPHYFSWGGKTYANYNYFVMNKDTTEDDLANSILTYLSSDIWAENFLKEYPYYLPALLSLESDKLEEKISPSYNIILKDFFDNNYELWSFDKWMINVYDKEIVPILDNSSNYLSDFENFRKKIICKTNKAINLSNLSNKCD